MPLPYLLSYGRQRFSPLAFFTAISLLTLRVVAGSPGAVDTAFDAGDIDGNIQEIVARPDGRLLLRGTFTRIQGMPRPGLARLLADGTLDAGFDPGTGVDGALSSFAVQADGRILLAGTFTAFNGIARTNFARLNADGSLDTGFATPADVPFVAGMARRVFALATGQSLDLGWQSRSSFSLFRHTANGDFDLIFERTELSGSTQPILAVQADGRPLLGLTAAQLNGQSPASSGLLRLNPDGGVDPTFNCPGYQAPSVWVVAPLPDGRIVLGGSFASIPALPRNRLARLNADGSLDASFGGAAGPDASVSGITPLPDGALLVWGSFHQIDGVPRAGVALLNPDGSVNGEFDLGAGLDGAVSAAAAQADGKLVLAGTFTQPGGVARPRLARVFSATGGESSKPRIIAPPTRLTVERTLPGALTVIATGQLPLQFQWLRNGEAITGATNSSLAWPALSDPDAGAYAVEVRNPLGEVRSEPAQLEVVPPVPRPGRMDLKYRGFPPSNLSVVSVLAAAAQPDGRLLIGGSITKVGTLNAYGVLRLHADGTLDPGFDPGIGITNVSGRGRTVRAILPQPDGRVLVGGEFFTYHGLQRPGLARLLPNGTVDRGFISPGSMNDRVQTIALQPDGRILVGGWFTERLVRLLPDGTADATFAPSISWSHVHSVAIQPDGRLVVCGDQSVLRLNPDGTPDPSFGPGITANDTIWSLALAEDGGVFIGGAFGAIGGTVCQRVARLTGDGQLDPRFNTTKAADATVMRVLGVPGNRVLAVGAFRNFATTTPRGVALIETNGARAADFHVGSGAMRSLVVGATLECATTLPDGSLIVGGDLTLFNGLGATGVVRLVDPVQLPMPPRFMGGVTNLTLREGDQLSLHAEALGGIPMSYQWLRDGQPVPGGTSFALNLERVAQAARGEYAVVISNAAGVVTNVVAQVDVLAPAPTRWTVDPAFAPALWNPPSVVRLALQPNGRILAAGEFTHVNGALRRRLARLNADGSLDPSFDPGEGADGHITALLLQPDGKVVVGGYFHRLNSHRQASIARLNPDGTADPTFTASPEFWPEEMVLQPDGRLIVAGRFATPAGKGMVRLNADGSQDPDFNAGTDHLYTDAALLADGSVFGADLFDPLVVRLHADGRFDRSMTLAATESSSVLALTHDGQLLIAKTGVTRWTIDGLPSPGWQNIGRPMVTACLVEQPDGRILAGGAEYPTGAPARQPLVRLQSDGTLDDGFAPNLGDPSGRTVQVNAIAFAGPDAILVGGAFTRAGEVPVTALARLRSDGSVDPTFTVELKNGGSVRAIARYGDTNLLAGGSFLAVNDTAQPNLTAVSFDGSVNTNLHLGRGLGSQVNALEPIAPGYGAEVAIGGAFTTANISRAVGLATIADGKLVAGGGFFAATAFPELNKLRFTTSGDLLLGGSIGLGRSGSPFTPKAMIDTRFTGPVIDGAVRGLAVTASGAVLAGGTFTKVGSTARAGLASFILSGSYPFTTAVLDTNFTATLHPGAIVNVLETTGLGQVLVGGFFTNVSGVACTHLVSLNPDGPIDPVFAAPGGTDDEVRVLIPLPDHRVAVGGDFSALNGAPRSHLGLLRFNGQLDDAADFGAGANGRVNSLLALEDGSLIVGGEFTTFDGIPRNGLVRLVPRPVQPLAPPRLTSPAFVGNSFAITVATQAGHDYQLEYRDALESGTWQSLPPVAGDGTARVLVDPAPPATARFYRVTAK